MPAVRYESDPRTGLYTFYDEQDKPRMGFGPEAEQLASWIDKTRPRPIASNEQPSPQMANWIESTTARERATPQAQDVPIPSPIAQSVQPPNVPQVPYQGTPEAQSTLQTPVATDGTQPYQGALGSREQDLSYITAPVRTGGHRAFDPRAEASARFPVPVTQTTKTEGGLEETPEERQARLDAEQRRQQLFEDAQKAATASYQVQSAVNERTAMQAKLDAFDTATQLKAKQDEMASQEELYQADMARLEGERRAVAGMKVDPKRLFSGKPGLQIGAALAMAFGAFGAAMAGTRNFAQDIVMNSINQDVDSQMEEIRNRGSETRNAIADISNRYRFSVGESKEIVKQLQIKHAEAVSAQTAAQIGTAEALRKHQEFMLKMEQEHALSEAKLREMHRGRTTQVTTAKMLAPQAATGGVLRAPTAKEMKERAQTVGAIRKATGAEQDPLALRAQAQQRQAAVSEHRIKLDTDQQIQEYGKERIANEKAMSAIERVISAAGGSLDTSTGKVTRPEGDIPGLGATGKNPAPFPDFPYSALTEQGKTVRDAFEGAQMIIGQALSGAAVSAQERQKIGRMIGEARTDEEAMRALEYTYRAIKENNEKLGGAYGPDIAAEYEKRMKDEQRRQNQSGGPEVEPY